MSYATETIKSIFDSLYSVLRRQYAQYVKNYNSAQYFVFADIVFKQAFRVPFYTSQSEAFTQGSPAGYVPFDISRYYLKERPVFYSRTDVDFLSTYISGGSPDVSYFTPIFLLNILVNGTYTDVYINYDPSLIDAKIYIKDGEVIGANETNILALKTILDKNLGNIANTYNQCLILLANPKYNDSDGFVKYYKGFLENEIARYQANQNYIVKVCAECGASDLIASKPANVSLIMIAGGPSLIFLTTAYSQFSNLMDYQQSFYNNSQPDMAELAKRFKAVAVVNAQPNLNSTTNGQYTTLPSVTIKGNKNNWLLLGALGLGLIVMNGKPKR
jgi:hypothetical protein